MEAAQRCFELIDKDDSGTLTKEEIVVAVKSDKEVIDFLKTCGEPNLVALTQPARLSKALDMLDTSKDGEMDMDEWMAACGNPHLQYLLVPARLEAALAELDTDRSGEVDLPEWRGRRVVTRCRRRL